MRTLQKRRQSTTGLSLEEELACWKGTFITGRDYFGDLKKVGIDSKTCEQAVFLEQAGEAWNRLGANFLTTWIPTASRLEPWALEEFGEPA